MNNKIETEKIPYKSAFELKEDKEKVKEKEKGCYVRNIVGVIEVSYTRHVFI